MTVVVPRQLLLIRHAKAAPSDGDDMQRPLSARGHRAAAELAALLGAVSPGPQLVVCSPSVRTRQTLGHLVDVLPDDASAHLDPTLYPGSLDASLALLRKVPGRVRRVAVIGHNPWLEDLLHVLLEPGASRDVEFPTAACAVLQLAAGRWNDLGPGHATLEALHRPRG